MEDKIKKIFFYMNDNFEFIYIDVTSAKVSASRNFLSSPIESLLIPFWISSLVAMFLIPFLNVDISTIGPAKS